MSPPHLTLQPLLMPWMPLSGLSEHTRGALFLTHCDLHPLHALSEWLQDHARCQQFIPSWHAEFLKRWPQLSLDRRGAALEALPFGTYPLGSNISLESMTMPGHFIGIDKKVQQDPIVLHCIPDMKLALMHISLYLLQISIFNHYICNRELQSWRRMMEAQTLESGTHSLSVRVMMGAAWETMELPKQQCLLSLHHHRAHSCCYLIKAS